MGKAVGHLVAAACILASRAELNVSTAMVDDEGVDLVFHRRGGTATLAVQVKSRMSDTKRVQSGGFVALVRKQTFRPRSDLYMLFVPVDVSTGNFSAVWLVPSADFEKGAQRSGERLRFGASLKCGTKDKWSSYRLTRELLPRQLLTLLNELER
jgi:hypothetical protein